MKVRLILVGKTQQGYAQEGTEVFKKRIINYLPFDEIVIPSLKNTKNLSPQVVKEKEGELILKKIEKQDFTILLDENGRTFDSVEFANFLQMQMNSGIKNLNFVVGGAWGFSPQVYQNANAKISLSKMTFSHQIIRIIFMEQLYRAMTILRNEPYHNS
jgi:23S rRNA (pseudouridine1915-N3)-methyltransferase